MPVGPSAVRPFPGAPPVEAAVTRGQNLMALLPRLWPRLASLPPL